MNRPAHPNNTTPAPKQDHDQTCLLTVCLCQCLLFLIVLSISYANADSPSAQTNSTNITIGNNTRDPDFPNATTLWAFVLFGACTFIFSALSLGQCISNKSPSSHSEKPAAPSFV